MSGEANVAGVALANVVLDIDQAGARISGGYDTGAQTLTLSGSIDADGVSLNGNSSVRIPVKGVTEAFQTVTDGTLCGWDKVNCLAHIVTDGALCGWKNVVDGGDCVGNLISDGVQCGVANISSIFTTGQTTDCHVVNSCVPKSCPSTQCDLPRSCPQPTQVEIAGNFSGRVGVGLNNRGLSGGLYGQYCSAANRCADIWEGTVSFTPQGAQACVSVPVFGNQCQYF
jgi:hypothetical protein